MTETIKYSEIELSRPIDDVENNVVASSLDKTATTLSFSNLRVTTKRGVQKLLLRDISGCIDGGYWAILGASGSGKTTLLSALSLRLDTRNMNITGDLRLNGQEYTRNMLKSMSA